MQTKEKVIEYLNKNKNASVSGETLAELCNVSRAAIWKAVQTLREEGFNIEGTTGGGYVLKGISDVFSEDLFKACFFENYPEFKNSTIECFTEIDSTNSYAKRLLAKAGSLYDSNGSLTEDGKKLSDSIYFAESQTAGRGRMGRTFYSPSKTGIYISMIYAPKGGIKSPAQITAFTAVAVRRAIKKVCGIDAEIKWINDLFYNGKKICGILAEGVTNFENGIIEAAVDGIGINIHDNPEVFPEEVEKVAGGIEKNVSRCELAAFVAGETLRIFHENPREVIDEYKKASFLLGKEIQVHPVISTEKGVYSAKAIDVDENAGLVIQTEDGKIQTLSSGEVRVRLDS